MVARTEQGWRDRAEVVSRKLTAVEVLQDMVIEAFHDGRSQGWEEGYHLGTIRAAIRVLDDVVAPAPPFEREETEHSLSCRCAECDPDYA